MTTPVAPLPKCPNCNSIIPRGKVRCVSCAMEVSKMDDYRKAKAAAESGRVTKAKFQIQPGHVKVAILVIVLGLAGYGVYWFFKKPTPWKDLPSDPQASVQKYLALIADDNSPRDEAHKEAYTMIAASHKNPDSQGEPDRYLQYFHDVHRYFAEVARDQNWAGQAKIAPDPKQKNMFVIQIGPEVVHVAVIDQAPEGSSSPHFGVTPFVEIDPNSDARRKSGTIELGVGVGRAYGAESGVGALKQLIARGNFAHETPIDKKMRIFPLLNEKSPSKASEVEQFIALLWPIRTDPTVQWRLKRIMVDTEYAPSTRERARKVVEGTLEGENRGVNDFE